MSCQTLFLTPIFSGGRKLPRIPKGIWSKIPEQHRSERYLRLIEDLIRFTSPLSVSLAPYSHSLSGTNIEIEELYSKHFSFLLELLLPSLSDNSFEQILNDIERYLFSNQIDLEQRELELKLLKEIIQCGLLGECWRRELEEREKKIDSKSKLFEIVYETSFYQHLFELSRWSNFVFESKGEKEKLVESLLLLKEFLFDFLPFRVQTKLVQLEKGKSVIDEETEKAKEILGEFLYGFLDRSTIFVDGGKRLVFRPIFYISNDGFPRIHSLCSQELKGEHIYQVLKNSIEEFVKYRGGQQNNYRFSLSVKYIDVKSSLLRFTLYDFFVRKILLNRETDVKLSYFEDTVILNEDLDLYELFVEGLKRVITNYLFRSVNSTPDKEQKKKKFSEFLKSLETDRNKVKRLVSTILNFGLSSHGTKELLEILLSTNDNGFLNFSELYNFFQQRLDELTTEMFLESKNMTNEVFLSELLALLALEQLLKNYRIYSKQGKDFYERFIKRPKNLLNFLLQFRFNNYFLFREIENVISRNKTKNNLVVLLMDYKFDGYVLLTVEGS